MKYDDLNKIDLVMIEESFKKRDVVWVGYVYRLGKTWISKKRYVILTKGMDEHVFENDIEYKIMEDKIISIKKLKIEED